MSRIKIIYMYSKYFFQNIENHGMKVVYGPN